MDKFITDLRKLHGNFMMIQQWEKAKQIAIYGCDLFKITSDRERITIVMKNLTFVIDKLCDMLYSSHHRYEEDIPKLFEQA